MYPRGGIALTWPVTHRLKYDIASVIVSLYISIKRRLKGEADSFVRHKGSGIVSTPHLRVSHGGGLHMTDNKKLSPYVAVACHLFIPTPFHGSRSTTITVGGGYDPKHHTGEAGEGQGQGSSPLALPPTSPCARTAPKWSLAWQGAWGGVRKLTQGQRWSTWL